MFNKTVFQPFIQYHYLLFIVSFEIYLAALMSLYLSPATKETVFEFHWELLELEEIRINGFIFCKSLNMYVPCISFKYFIEIMIFFLVIQPNYLTTSNTRYLLFSLCNREIHNWREFVLLIFSKFIYYKSKWETVLIFFEARLTSVEQ